MQYCRLSRRMNELSSSFDVQKSSLLDGSRDQILKTNEESLTSSNNDDKSLSERGASSEASSPTSEQIRKSTLKRNANDFKFGKVLGEGSFSMVYIAKDIHNGRECAIKVCEKSLILKEKKHEAIMREKKILNILNANPSPFFIQLYCSFQDSARLYFVTSYARGGELLTHLVRVGSFDENCTRFYAGEIILALEHLHGLNIIHRDLKPENILLTEKMHIQLSDFGSAKILDAESPPVLSASPEKRERTRSFVGTAQYVSPEMLNGKNSSPMSDIWAWGCIIYYMLSSVMPFRAANEYLIFQKVMAVTYEIPEKFPDIARNLIEKILVLDPMQRLGATDFEDENTKGYPSIKCHPFFLGLVWNDLHLQTPPEIGPCLPATSSNEELRSRYEVPDHIEPGFDAKQLGRLLDLGLSDNFELKCHDDSSSSGGVENPQRSGILNIESREMERRLAEQAEENIWHRFAQGNLILKQGLIEKKKGFFTRKRMLLLTTGPRLFYVDPSRMVLKGEIPWTSELKVEPKNFKVFFVHTPKRIYYLEDTGGFGLEWCRMIHKVHSSAFPGTPEETPTWLKGSFSPSKKSSSPKKSTSK